MDRLEEVLGHCFRDRDLLAMASDTARRGFGVLEHLGDAVADLAVGVACWRSGEGSAVASAIVANQALDTVFERSLRGLVRARSGDAVEALVGAVHLDAGFEVAAEVALRLCIPGRDWEPLPEHRLGDFLPADPKRFPAWLGALAIDAIVTDFLVRQLGPAETSQAELSERRSMVTSRQNLRSLSAQVPFAPHVDAVAELRSSVIATLLGAGWESTRLLAASRML